MGRLRSLVSASSSASELENLIVQAPLSPVSELLSPLSNGDAEDRPAVLREFSVDTLNLPATSRGEHSDGDSSEFSTTLTSTGKRGGGAGIAVGRQHRNAGPRSPGDVPATNQPSALATEAKLPLPPLASSAPRRKSHKASITNAVISASKYLVTVHSTAAVSHPVVSVEKTKSMYGAGRVCSVFPLSHA
jgi:hypothetical protein